MDLSFLKNVEVKEVAPKMRAERIKLEKFPVPGAHFRVYKNGRIFTDPDIADQYNLNHGPKEEIVIPGKDTAEDKVKLVKSGNGLDIFSSENWQMIATPEPMLFIAIVPRAGNPKIDVYGSTSYDNAGEPTRNIDTNTISSFGKTFLVPKLEELYDIDFEKNDFVDLVMNTEYAIEAPRGVFSIPKTVSRGESKGELTFLTRKDITVFPLTVFEAEEIDEVDTQSSGAEAGQVDLEDSIKEVKSADVTNIKKKDTKKKDAKKEQVVNDGLHSDN